MSLLSSCHRKKIFPYFVASYTNDKKLKFREGLTKDTANRIGQNIAPVVRRDNDGNDWPSSKYTG